MGGSKGGSSTRRRAAARRRDDGTGVGARQRQEDRQWETKPRFRRSGAERGGPHLLPSIWVGFAVLLAATFAAYYPSLSGGFVWDDDIFVSSPQVTTWGGIYDIWFKPGTIRFEAHYWPVVYTSFWLEHKLWGFDDPTPFHVMNVLLHVANACLVQRILVQRLGQSEMAAWISAFVFALHPVRVESVAWIIERKDTLSGLFYLLVLLVHPNMYPDGYGPQEGVERRDACLGALALYVLGVLTKSVVVTLPVVLLIVPWMLRGKIRTRELLDTMPFFCIGLILALYDMSQDQSSDVGFGYSLVERVLIGSRAVCFYLYKLIWPVDLVMIYPRWHVSKDPPWMWWSCFATVSTSLVGMWAARHSFLGRGPLAAILFFGATLGPTLGLIDYSYMQYSFVADRFQYLAGIGPVAVLAAAFATFLGHHEGNRYRRVAATALCLMLFVFAVLTNQHCCHFVDDESFFSRVVDRDHASFQGWLNLGYLRMKRGESEAAAECFANGAKSIRDDIPEHILRRQRVQAHTNHGIVLTNLKRYNESVAELEKALEFNPDHSKALNALGNAHSGVGRRDEALRYLRRAVEVDPAYAIAWGNLGAELGRMGRYEEALEPLGRASALQPSNVKPTLNRGIALRNMGRVEESMEEFQSALERDPTHRAARQYLDEALAKLEKKKIGRTTIKEIRVSK